MRKGLDVPNIDKIPLDYSRCSDLVDPTISEGGEQPLPSLPLNPKTERKKEKLK
jgi:hypothetical protein